MCTEDTEADLDRAGMAVGRRSFAALAGAGALIAALPARAMAGKPVKGPRCRDYDGGGHLRRLFRGPYQRQASRAC